MNAPEFSENGLLRHTRRYNLQLRLFNFALLITLVASCSSQQTKIVPPGSPITLTYWSATNAQELEFAHRVAASWNSQHPEVQIKVEPVPSGQSSEEVILAAVASNTTPDVYANTFPGALADLLDAKAVVQLDVYQDFYDVMRERMSPELLEQYVSADGHYYQLPWKANPVMVLYNTGMLRDAGVSSLPTTYSEFLSAAARVTRDRDGDGRTDQWMATIDYFPTWYKRLFDYYPLYLAANGQKLNVDRRIMFDNESSVAVFQFLRECFTRGYVPRQSFQGDGFLQGRVAARFTGPYSISHLERYRSTDFEYAFGPVPRPDNSSGAPVSYADPKSMIIFRTCQHQHEAWEFLKFAVSKQNDLLLLELTSQLPIRARLLDDRAFADYFQRNQRMIPFAEQLLRAHSIDSLPELKEIFDAIAQAFEASVVLDLKSPEQAVHDAATRSQQILDVE